MAMAESYRQRAVPRGLYSKVSAVKLWQASPYGEVATRKPQQPSATPPARRLGSTKRGEVPEDHGNVVFNCSSLDQWHLPENDSYKGLRVARSIDPYEWQFVADQFATEFKGNQEKSDDSLHSEIIDLCASDALLQRKFKDAALAVSSRLPPALAKRVCQDALELAGATCKLLPQARELVMGIQIFGSNTCSQWHRDHMVCRSIVSYNCSATLYTADSNVDFDELLNCGNQDHIIRDKSRIHSCDVGDMLLMKGKKYPGTERGFMHKSPALRYSDTGDVKSRLVLTVEVLDLAGGKVENSCNGD